MHQSLKGFYTLLRIELIIRRNRPSYQHPLVLRALLRVKPLYSYPKPYPKSKRGLLPLKAVSLYSNLFGYIDGCKKPFHFCKEYERVLFFWTELALQ